MVDYHLLQDGDADDAGNVSTVLGHPNLADYAPQGLLVENVDYSLETFDLTAGKAFVLLDTETTASDAETRHLTLRTMHFDARTAASGTEISLAGSGLNHVFARLNLRTNDSPKIDVFIDGKEDNATADSVKLATVDTSSQTVDNDFNREPDGLFDQLTATDIDATTVNVDTLYWQDGTKQTGPGVQQGEPLDAENYYYDDSPSDGSSPPGKVRRSANSDQADSVASGGTVPGGTVQSPIDAINTRYDSGGDGTVDNSELANNATQISNRTLSQLVYEIATKSKTGTIPFAEIKSGQPTGFTQALDSRTIKVWSWSVHQEGNDVSSLVLRLRAGDGTILKTFDPAGSEERSGGFLNDSPLYTTNNRDVIHMEIYHTDGSSVAASATVGFTVE